jgi:hypothetical protein
MSEELRAERAEEEAGVPQQDEAVQEQAEALVQTAASEEELPPALVEASGEEAAEQAAQELQAVEQSDEEAEKDPYLNREELSEMIEEVCNSKAKELHLLGYEQVTGADVWACVSSKYKRELPPLHKLINDILSLKATAFMNWLLIQTYKQ